MMRGAESAERYTRGIELSSIECHFRTPRERKFNYELLSALEVGG